jgi:hypothetical protein
MDGVDPGWGEIPHLHLDDGIQIGVRDRVEPHVR